MIRAFETKQYGKNMKKKNLCENNTLSIICAYERNNERN